MSAHAGNNLVRWFPLMRRPRLTSLLALLLAWPGAAAARDQGDLLTPEQQRPADLVVLRRWHSMEGNFAIGVFGAKPDPNDAEARTIGIWVENPTGVRQATETIRCSPTAPMRLGRESRGLVLKELNPGGQITDANRLDHQIWWAACFPALAGQDPAQLRARARQLGYSGQLTEREQVLPGSPR